MTPVSFVKIMVSYEVCRVGHRLDSTFTETLYYRIGHGPEVIKLFSCSTRLSMKIFQLINVKMPTKLINVKMPKIVGILTFMSRKNNILGSSESK